VRAFRGPRVESSGRRALARERILFVCTANVDRSRTAEDLYKDDPRFEVRSAGTAPFAQNPVDRELLRWADRVFVMSEREDGHQSLLRFRFPDVQRPVVDLDIEDRWKRGHPELVRRLLKALRPHLGPPEAGG
jgi:protein-tyrosine phosphatase